MDRHEHTSIALREVNVPGETSRMHRDIWNWSFDLGAVTLWNDHPNLTRFQKSISTFKWGLKTHLLKLTCSV